MAKLLVGRALAATLLFVALPAFSQSEPSPTPAYPNQAPASGASTPATVPPPAGAQPATYPAQPATYPAQPPPAANPSYPPASQGGANAYDRQIVEPQPPPPPLPEEQKSFEFPDMSVRLDPLNWLIYGRLGLELEAVAWKFISVEVVPVFVTNDQPPAMNLGSFPANIYQGSNGLGAMSGASIGAGFWLGRKPFEGTVLRLIYANYGYTYTSKDDNGVQVDRASHTDRRLYGFIGSHSKWGPFTIASGIGLGMELNRERRCMDTSVTHVIPTTANCRKEVFEVQLRDGEGYAVSIYDRLHPVYLEFRLSLGFVF